jgi:Phage gp6-like head-tail connector protein
VTAQVFYDSASEIALISVSFTNAAGALADPTTVSCVITEPANVAVTHTYLGAAPADIVRVSTGKYTLSVPCAPSVTGVDGLWGFRFIGTGAVSDEQPGTWRVLPVNVSQVWYVGLEEMKSRLNVTDPDDDYELQTAIAASAGYINEYCGQAFNRVTETRTFVPHDIWLLNTDPLVSVSALNIDRDGDGVFEEPWVQGTDYQLRLGPRQYNVNTLGVARPYRQVQVLQSGKLFPFLLPYGRQDKVQIIGTWNWPAVPWQVAEANRILAAQVFKEKDAPFGIAGISDLGIARISSSPTLVMMLERFIAPRYKVGI